MDRARVRVANPDGGGPGLYASTDPTATATWGLETPGLFVLTLKNGSNILKGDVEVANLEKKRLNDLYERMSCGDNRFGNSQTDFADLVVRFRNADNRNCRRMIIEAFSKMEIRAITYGFYSSPLSNCRVTCTAVNIIWPDAIKLKDINYYAEGVAIEGYSQLTPYVKALFNEGKRYFCSRSFLSNLNMVAQFDNAFGFFLGARDVDSASYERWKANHILRCGPKWPTEIPDMREALLLNAKNNADPELQDLWIQTAMAYKRRYFSLAREVGESAGPAHEFKPEGMRQIQAQPKEAFNGDFHSDLNKRMLQAFAEIDPQRYNHPAFVGLAARAAGFSPQASLAMFNTFQFMSGNIPILEGELPADFNQDVSVLFARNRKIWSGILRQCLNVYLDSNLSNEQVFAGPCGVVEASD